MAKILKNSEQTLRECAKRLVEGYLVAFPTETVYGLGASLWHEKAIQNVFHAKKRPSSDPLIVHVATFSDCEKLVTLNEFQSKCFAILAQAFWPGPLTMVVPASKVVSKSATAGGDYVGIRIPSNPIAQTLLKLCGDPIVAPSANTFGHVSPTSAQHVYDDLRNEPDLWIIEQDNPCDVGIESTVVKIESSGRLKLLRPGAVSASEILNELNKNGIVCECDAQNRIVSHETKYETKPETQPENKIQESPGQNLTHYSPWIETWILTKKLEECDTRFAVKKVQSILKDELKTAVILDFHKQYENLKQSVLFYQDLSEKGDFEEAAQNLFRALRELENLPGVQKILIAQFELITPMSIALYDRIYRAASGKFVHLSLC